MASDSVIGKLPMEYFIEPPRMVSDTDVALVRSFAAKLPAGTEIVEFGPWLGGVTRVLTQFGKVHAVDRFEWSELNETAYPGLVEPGKSFRHLFEQIVDSSTAAIEVHQTSFRDFVWEGPEIGLCFIDAPRTASGLLLCLLKVSNALSADGFILVKNALNAKYLDMVALIEILVGRGYFEICQTDQPRWCNIAVLKPGKRLGELAEFQLNTLTFAAEPVSIEVKDPWNGAFFVAARLANTFAAGDLKAALSLLQALPENPELLYAWDQIEEQMDTESLSDEDRTVFAELLSAHIQKKVGPADPRGSIAMALRAWWVNTTGKAWQSAGFSAAMIEDAFVEGSLDLVGRSIDQIHDRHIWEIGTNLDHSAVSFLTAGANSYTGFVLGDLTRSLVKTELALEPVTYLPLISMNPEHVKGVDRILVHENVLDHSDVRKALEQIDKVAEPSTSRYVLPSNGGELKLLRL